MNKRHDPKVGVFRIEETGQEYTYGSIFEPGTEVVNQATLDEIRMGIQHPHLMCLCHLVGPIAMHFQRHRIGDQMVRFWDNRNNELSHVADCPRARSEDVRASKERKQVASGEKIYIAADGYEHSDSNIGDIFAPEDDDKEEMTRASPVRVDTAKGEEPSDLNDSSGQRTRVRVVRGNTKFGGLIRNWYVMGYKWAADYAKTRDGVRISAENLSVQNVLWGMWTVLYMKLVEANGKPLEKIAFVPHPSRRNKRVDGEHKLILGVVGKVREGTQGLDITVHGIGDRWMVRIPQGKAPRRRRAETWGNRLIAVRAVYRDLEMEYYEATHRPFLVQLVEPGGVWVDSSYEARLYHELRSRHFQVDKPLRDSEEFYGYRPDFVLRGFRSPVIIEVYGVQNMASYDEHKETKRRVYRAAMAQGLVWYLEWDVTVANSWDKLIRDLDLLSRSTEIW
ncbi:hypothetical protein LLE49_27825 [Alicyclobacillus tolerans]|uniref:hypothetical protein n=1 Tax=Alicyclobacillus tolerans TaxID=90970 RepID=UPI001F1E32F9|nr:hypothetical protein [Alicyclobacillus tolerans]MCF8568532.1 hypothetical protein [Alicyclobacillus tolerans]